MKKRIDLILVKKKIAESRNKAQAMIRAGQIFINDKKVLKSGELYKFDNLGVISKNLHQEWVSRGALKLLKAIKYFKINVTDFICLDIGASTGGFTQVLLSKNASKVFCVDVGTDQLHKKLVNNPRVVNIPKTNARYIDDSIVSEKVDIIVCDVSFISMKKVIKSSLSFLNPDLGIIIALIKPQFECEKNTIKKRGIIKDSIIHKKICDDYFKWFESVCKMKVLGIIPSPINGSKGNLEFLICAKKIIDS